MKIKPEHYAHLKSCIAKIADSIPARIAAIAVDPKVKDADKRLRWNLMYASVDCRWVCDNIYSYANDTHMDTALRNIVAELTTAAITGQ